MSRQEVITNQLHLFDSVVNSKWFPNTIFILFLSNVSGFRRDLEVSPLQESFPDYTGENSVEEAGEYMLQRFREINRAQRTLYSYLVDLEPYDPGNLELLFAAIKDAIGASSRSEASDEVY
jgi:guanine nucleotide-binding protein G(i) subunit alpha